jgi:hypothetical protein
MDLDSSALANPARCGRSERRGRLKEALLSTRGFVFLAVHRSKALLLPSGLLILTVFVGGCAHLPQLRESFDDSLSALMNIFPSGEGESTKPVRENSSGRLARLTRENARLQADLEAAEAVLVEEELRLSGSHTRADAVSTLAMTRIQVE